MRELAADCDQVVAAAAMIGGISYFHEFAYDLLAENERILASTFDAAIAAHRDGHLERIVVMSARRWSTSRRRSSRRPEGAQLTSPPPISTYGFQKLASEYFAKGAWEQYELPYTIVRPFNCVGHRRAPGAARHGHHVRQREARPVARRPGPRRSRCSRARTRSTSSATGRRSATTRTAATSPTASGSRWSRPDASTRTSTSRPPQSTTVLELAECDLAQGPRRRTAPFRYVSDPPFEHDVQLRVPDVRKAREVLGFEATTTLDDDARRGHPVDPGRGGGRPAVSRLLPELYDARFDEREVSAKDAVWREIVALPAAVRRSRRAGPRHRLRPRPLHPLRSAPASGGRRDIRDMRAPAARGRPVRPGVRPRPGRACCRPATSAPSS